MWAWNPKVLKFLKQSSKLYILFIYIVIYTKLTKNRDLPHFTISLDGKSAINSITQITQSRASYNPQILVRNYQTTKQMGKFVEEIFSP